MSLSPLVFEDQMVGAAPDSSNVISLVLYLDFHFFFIESFFSILYKTLF